MVQKDSIRPETATNPLGRRGGNVERVVVREPARDEWIGQDRQRFLAGTAFEDLRLASRAETPRFRRSAFFSEIEVAQDTEPASLSSFRAMRIASAAGRPTSRSSRRATDARSDMSKVCSAVLTPSSDGILVARVR